MPLQDTDNFIVSEDLTGTNFRINAGDLKTYFAGAGGAGGSASIESVSAGAVPQIWTNARHTFTGSPSTEPINWATYNGFQISSHPGIQPTGLNAAGPTYAISTMGSSIHVMGFGDGKFDITDQGAAGGARYGPRSFDFSGCSVHSTLETYVANVAVPDNLQQVVTLPQFTILAGATQGTNVARHLRFTAQFNKSIGNVDASYFKLAPGGEPLDGGTIVTTNIGYIVIEVKAVGANTGYDGSPANYAATAQGIYDGLQAYINGGGKIGNVIIRMGGVNTPDAATQTIMTNVVNLRDPGLAQSTVCSFQLGTVTVTNP